LVSTCSMTRFFLVFFALNMLKNEFERLKTHSLNFFDHYNGDKKTELEDEASLQHLIFVFLKKEIKRTNNRSSTLQIRKKNMFRCAGLDLKAHMSGLFLLEPSVLGHRLTLLGFFWLFFRYKKKIT